MFMKRVEEENFVKRLSRQDIHKNQLQKFDKLLSEAMENLNVCLCELYELSVAILHQINLQMNTLQMQLDAALVYQQKHAELLDVSHMSESERQVG